MNRPIKIGSLFAGIGGFELGLERAIPGAETVWQVEQNQFCQKILKKHWPNAKIFDDVRTVNKNNLEPVDIICGGFPCQDISIAGKQKGLDGEKSGLWFEMLRLISELRPRIAVLENVAAVTFRGLPDILGGLSEIGYDAEWQIISARQFGAPHLRKRWFCVAYPNGSRLQTQGAEQQTARNFQFRKLDRQNKPSVSDIRRPIANADQIAQRKKKTASAGRSPAIVSAAESEWGTDNTADAIGKHAQISPERKYTIKQKFGSKSKDRTIRETYWHKKTMPKPIICRMVNGVPERVARLKALGNAIVPQCSEYIGHHILNSGLLDD